MENLRKGFLVVTMFLMMVATSVAGTANPVSVDLTQTKLNDLAALQVPAADLPAWIHKSRPVGARTLSIPAFAKINAAMQNKGTAKIIVRFVPPLGLAAGFTLEGTLLSTESVNNQRAHIARIQNNLASMLSKSHAAAAKRFDFIPFMAMEVDPTEFSTLAASSDIDLIEEDIPVPPSLIQSVPLIGGSNGSFNGYTGSGQTVAILDTGVDKTHPFLTGKVVSDACYSTTDSISTALCTSGSTASGSGANCSASIDGCDHATHVAGIVAGKGSTFSGVANDANLISIQVFSQFPASECGSGATAPCIMTYTSDQISAMNRVYSLRGTYNISSVNMSFGGGKFTANCDVNANYTAEKSAIDTLRSVGIATVIASGNESYSNAISGPACISTAISVGATDKSDMVANYSNSASILNLLAPGSSIYSSIPGGTYAYLYGTSMATPHVAGAWAVLKSAKPTATVTEILNALASTGESITDTRNGIVKPRIRLDVAVNALIGGAVDGTCGSSSNQALSVAPSTNLCTIGTPSTVTGSGPWNWTCSGSNGGATANCTAYTPAQQVTMLTQNFDSVTPEALPGGWQSVAGSGTGGAWATHAGTRNPSGIGAHSPSNLVYFNSYDTDSGTTALLTSPVFSLAGTAGGKASLWMYHDTEYSSADGIDVYINSASNLIGATLLGSVSRYNGADGWTQYTFDIPGTYTGSTNFLIINGISDYGNDIHLDDISVYAFSGASTTTYTVTPSAGANGSISPSTPQSVASGATTTFTITPNSGYTVVTPIGGTCPQGTYNPSTKVYTTGAIIANCTVVPTFSTSQTNLKAGWNFIGWTTGQGYYEGTTAPSASEMASSAVMNSMAMSALFGTIGFTAGDSFVIVGPDGVVYMPGSPFNTLNKALPGKGYWFYTPSDKSVIIPGDPLLPSAHLPLNAGWTQIGYWGTDGVAPATGFRCINGLYDILVDESGKVYMTGSPFNTLSSLQQNKGYFIHTTAPATLTYQCP